VTPYCILYINRYHLHATGMFYVNCRRVTMAEFMFRLEKKINTIVNSRGVDPGGPPPNILLKGPCISRTPPIIKLQNVHPCQSVIKIMKCLYCLNCPKFGQLIIRKIIRIVATGCQILGVKCTKFDFAPPQTPFGELTALP